MSDGTGNIGSCKKKKKKKMGEGCSKNPKTYLMLFSIFALIIPSLSHTQTHTHTEIVPKIKTFFSYHS